MTRTALLLCALFVAGVQAQTTGVPGQNDFTISGIGSGVTSVAAADLNPGFQQVDLRVEGPSGALVLGAFGTAAPGTLDVNGAGTHFLDVFPLTIWLNGTAPPFPFFPLSFLTVPPTGAWQIGLTANVPSGQVSTFQFALLDPSLPGGVVTTQALTLNGVSPLPNCTINFDSGCPNAPGGQCGATFSGGGGCIFAGLAFCYDTGLRSYGVSTGNSPANVSFSGNVNGLRFFFANQGPTAAGTITFFDSAGGQVGSPVAAVGDCLASMPNRMTISFPRPVRSAQIVATSGTVWIDTFEINP